MNKTRVVVIRCDTYADDQVLKAIQTGLDLLGGISLFAKAGLKQVAEHIARASSTD